MDWVVSYFVVWLVLLKQQSGGPLQRHEKLDQLLSLATYCFTRDCPFLVSSLYYSYLPYPLSQDFARLSSTVNRVYFHTILILELAIWLALVNRRWAVVIACRFWGKALRVVECFSLLLFPSCHLPWAEHEHPLCGCWSQNEGGMWNRCEPSPKAGVQPRPVWPSQAQARSCEPQPTCNPWARKINALVSH